MRKLKGITINGEWLGENVVVNGMFRAISSMAPFVMLEFVKLINQIDKLDEAVAIKKFNFLDNNSIEIEFTNSQIDGMADLYFRLHNGIPELTDKNLTFFAPNSPVEEVATKVIGEECEEVEETLEELPTETVEVKQDNVISDAETSDETEVAEIEDEIEASEENIEENSEDAIADLYEAKEESHVEETEQAPVENMTETLAKTQDAISMLVNDLAKNAQKVPPVQIQVIQAPAQQVSAQQEIAQQEIAEQNAQTVSQTAVQENIETEYKIGEADEVISGDTSETSAVESDTEINDTVEEPVFEDKFEEPTFTEEAKETDSVENDCSESDDTINTINIENIEIEGLKEEKFETLEEQPTEAEAKVETEVDTIAEEKGQDKQNDENTHINEDEIQECLLGFYEAPKNDEIEEICAQNPDNIVMQAMLNEMLVLKEELNKLKEEPQKPDVASFWGDNEKKSNYIDDSEADFRIMGSEKRVNASILDEEMFVAGDKLYKWGDMLYLEE